MGMKEVGVSKLNEAQKYLIENGLNDLILNDRHTTKPEEHIYASDTMMKFCADRYMKKLAQERLI